MRFLPQISVDNPVDKLKTLICANNLNNKLCKFNLEKFMLKLRRRLRPVKDGKLGYYDGQKNKHTADDFVCRKASRRADG